MTDPDPQTVDRIARAIYAQQAGPFSLTWNEAIEASNSPAHDAGLHAMGIGAATRAAHAALDAMPQPIGYGVWVDEHDELGERYLNRGAGVMRQEAEDEALERNRYFTHQHSTVVALVPVEDQ